MRITNNFPGTIAVNLRFSIFAIFDKKAEYYLNPFFLRNKGEALRTMEDLVTDSQSRICKHPHDYSIWKIGEWDEIQGILITLEHPEFLEEATAFVKKENQNGA